MQTEEWNKLSLKQKTSHTKSVDQFLSTSKVTRPLTLTLWFPGPADGFTNWLIRLPVGRQPVNIFWIEKPRFIKCSRLKITFTGVSSHEKYVLWLYMYKELWRREDQLWNQNLVVKVKLFKVQFNALDF